MPTIKAPNHKFIKRGNEVDFYFVRGDDVNWSLTFKDSNDAVINITGYELRFTVRTTFEPTDTTDSNVILKRIYTPSAPATGIIACVLSNVNTSVDVGTYYYDWQLKDGGGNITTVQIGKAIVIKDYTYLK